ncbi:MAG: histidine kinase N-terminal 7TM domain-containing protein, partial [Chloroflexota bacterium]
FFILAESSLTIFFSTLLVTLFCEYFGYKWLTRSRMGVLWTITVAFSLLEWTNEFHKLIWLGHEYNPQTPALLLIRHGPLFEWDNGYALLLFVTCFLITVYETIRSTRWRRVKASVLGASIAAPFLTYLVYLADATDLQGANLMPIGYSVTSILVTLIMVEDLLRSNDQYLLQLKTTILTLETEIDNRKHLEENLITTQDVLSTRLMDRTKKLAGLYDMILLVGKALPINELVELTLDQVRMILGCQAVSYFDQASNLRVYSFPAVGFELKPFVKVDNFDWVGAGKEVTILSDNLPDEVSQAGFGTCAGKVLLGQGHELGKFACFWEHRQKFTADEEALIAILSDEMCIILQNALMRESISTVAVQHERRRLARDLHDSVTQSLHSLVLSAETATAESGNPEKLARILRRMETSARQSLKEMRLLLYELRMSAPDGENLEKLISNRLEAVERRAGINTEFMIEPDVFLDNKLSFQFYALVMEILNNSIKHARASQVRIHFSNVAACLQMEIQDNGVGFNPETVRPGGMGIKTMAERCERLGANFDLITSPGQGTLIRIQVPKAKYELVDELDQEAIND